MRIRRIHLTAPALRMGLLGFGAALPLVLVWGTLSFRLREAGIDRPTIGFLSWVVLLWPFKWIWAPLVDRWNLPLLSRRLGRRRAWLLASQLAVAGGLLLMGLLDPLQHLPALIACALFTAFAGATQDIALDAFRIESVAAEAQAVLAAAYLTGYRLGMIWSGAGALWLAARAGGADGYAAQAWSVAYAVMAGSMAAGVLGVALAPEAAPAAAAGAPRGRLAAPFLEFVARYGRRAIWILALVSCYRLANIVMGVMANPFYHDIGFTKDQVAAVSKIYGVLMALVGGFAGGGLVLWLGIARMLWIAALGSSLSILLYALLAVRGPEVPLLALAISCDNFAEGIAATVFIAYLSALTNRQYSATQYAFLSSATLLLPKLLAGLSGLAVDAVGYAAFFCGCAASGSIALALIWVNRGFMPDQRRSNR